MKRASYRDAIAWIAHYDYDASPDEPSMSTLDLKAIESTRCVALVQGIFGVSTQEVAAEVLLLRTKARAEQLRKARAEGK